MNNQPQSSERPGVASLLLLLFLRSDQPSARSGWNRTPPAPPKRALLCVSTPCLVSSASFRLCCSCPAPRPSRWSSPSWWFSPSSYTTAAVTVATGARAPRRRRRTKTPARVTVTAGRRGGASAASRGWRWQLSHCAGEEEEEEDRHVVYHLHNCDISCRCVFLPHQAYF